MMRRSGGCPYLAQVRARWDGELADARVVELGAHVNGCPICQEEQRALERLAATLRRGDADVFISKQQHDRLKMALLERCLGSLSGRSHATASPATPSADHARSRPPGMRPCSLP